MVRPAARRARAHQPPRVDRLIPADCAQLIRDLRREIHRRPELAFEETETAARVSAALRDLGLEPRTQIDGTPGLYADLAGTEPGPCVALRADMDALPLLEETGLPFASEVPGRMHACGHDGHTAILVGAAELLRRHPPAEGSVRFLFQPGEEGGAGARRMVAGGALDGVTAIFGLHLDLRYAVGEVVAQAGPASAFSDRFTINIAGPGGHGAHPHGTVDTVVAAALVIMAMQTIVSRRISPAADVVVTVGRISGGQAANVIPQRVELQGTIRTTAPEVRKEVFDEIRRIADTAATLQEAVAEIDFFEGYPMAENDPEAADVAAQAVVNVLGPQGHVPLAEVNLGGEDFAFYQELVPGCLMRLGAAPQREVGPAHSPTFDFDEDSLAVGAAVLAEAARVALRSRKFRAGP